ncbi:hypothetical protein B9H02_04535 [Prosthecochloris sp. HL-130-GSB]|nr:hypothetical protein B9H02_04535 [Prosthecochloris sp. HL-130-GSB]
MKVNKALDPGAIRICYLVSAEHTVHDALTPEVSENDAVPPEKSHRIVFVFQYLEAWLLFCHHSLQADLFLKVNSSAPPAKYFSPKKNDTIESYLQMLCFRAETLSKKQELPYRKKEHIHEPRIIHVAHSSEHQ